MLEKKARSEILFYNDAGKCMSKEHFLEERYSLFIDKVKRTGYINIYKDSRCDDTPIGVVTGEVYATEELAKRQELVKDDKYYITTIPIEWKEEFNEYDYEHK